MRPIDLSRVRTIGLESRKSKVALAQMAQPPRPGLSFAEFLESLPQILAGSDFREVVQAITTARRNDRPVILGMGAHVIKCGLSPVIIHLMQQGIVTAVALNGSGAIHDVELALIGQTSEDVASGLRDGTFGMVQETGELVNRGVNRVLQQPERGMGELLAEELAGSGVAYPQFSILMAGRALNLPVTVHVAVGTDIVHMHPSANGAALGQATFNDFRLLTTVVGGLTGGVYLNVGSAVILPEVFLKAFTIAQNLGADLKDFVTVNIDMMAHYRPGENVVRRPAALGRAGYTLIGRHEIMVPLLAQAVVTQLEQARPEEHGQSQPTDTSSKLVSIEALVALRDRIRRQGKKLVWTNGCFDLIHAGHVRSLQAARKLGDLLVVGVNSDDSVRRLKGAGRPIVSATERIEVLSALACVDHVVMFEETTPAAVLSRLQPDICCKGADYAPPHGKPVPEANVIAAYGGRLEYLPLLPSLSTTELIRRIGEQPGQGSHGQR
jgi:rfaE bifunctional protein nucleotidyltransferase chain/domain